MHNLENIEKIKKMIRKVEIEVTDAKQRLKLRRKLNKMLRLQYEK